MSNARPSLFKSSIISVALVALAAFGNPVRAQEATEPAAPNAGFVDDWTHHHLIFSNPGARDDAVKHGTLEKWQKITNDPRYQLQQAKRTFGTRPVIADPDPGFGTGGSWDRNRDRGGNGNLHRISNSGIKKDWSTNLGSGTTSSLTATIAASLSSTNISGSSMLTIDGVTFDASPPTAASTEGTFTGNPPSGDTVIVGPLTMAASYSTANYQTGTFSKWPATPAVSTITVTNGGNTLSMTTTGSTQSTITSGTVTLPPLSTSSIGITSYPASGTSTTTTFTSAGTATATINSDPSGGTTITVGSITYTWHGNCSGDNDCVVHTGATTTDAQNLSNAIDGTCGGNACAANTAASAFYPGSGSVVYIVNLSTSAAVTLTNGSGTSVTLSTTSIPAASTNACSGTTGTFTPSTTIATLLGNLKTAINDCPAADGITVTGTPGTTITVTSTYYGNTTDFPFSASVSGYTGFTWGTVAPGLDGTNACSSPTTGTYATSSSTTTLATNLKTALQACAAANDPTIGLNVAQTTSSTNTVKVYENTWGTTTAPGTAPTITVAPTTTGFFQWAASPLAGGTNGTISATSFAVDNNNSDNATFLTTAINDTANATSGVIATHTGTNAYVTVTAYTPGTGANGAITLGGTAVGNGFSWGGGTTLGTGTAGVLGANGTTSGTSTPPTFSYWDTAGTGYDTGSALATQIANAVNANTTVNAVLTATAGTNDVVFTAKAAGPGGNVSVTPDLFTAFTGGTLSGGTAATVQPNAYPAKYGASLTTASCTGDFVVYPTGQAGAAGAANIIAYNNLYTTGCTTGTVPSVYWAYNTENGLSGYAVTSSPVISPDGTKVAFIQSNGTNSYLVVVKWGTGGTPSLTSPTTLSSTSNITTCTAPCMTVTALSHNDTYSSPYYDNSGDDALYVGDDSGYLEKFTGVFKGTTNPTGTSVSLNTAPYAIASPVYDSVSGCVFVGDTEGYLYSVSSGVAGTVCTGASFASFGRSAVLGGGANEGIFDGPLVDPVAETVYVFVADSGDVTTSKSAVLSIVAPWNVFDVVSGGPLTPADVNSYLNIAGFDDVAQIETVAANGLSGTLTAVQYGCEIASYFGFTICNDLPFTVSTTLTAGDNYVDEFLTSTIASGSTTATPVEVEPLGTGGAGYNIYSGAFDNVYFSSANGTGNLYAVGNTGTTTGATLYQIPITGSIAGVNSAVTGLTPNAANAYPWPSPATEFYSNSTDYLFFSVNRGTSCSTSAGNGCILSYSVNSPTSVTFKGAQNYTNVGTNGCWATGGIVIDNSASNITGAQQIYFVNLNGAAAGGVDGATPASGNCTSGAGPTIDAVQASQASP
jgi:hypothetical protein